MSIIDNINKINNLKKELSNHPMCLKIEESGTHFVVIYPEGMYPNGVRVSLGMGKIRALERLLQVVERHWNDNCVNKGD